MQAEAGEMLFGRRHAMAAIMSSFTVLALVREARAFEGPRPIGVRRWVEDQQDIASALSAGQMSGRQWARNVRELAQAVDVRELMAFVRRQQIKAAGAPFHNDPTKRFVRFIDEQGRPQRLAYGAALFDFEPANVVTPHGHRHMVSAHMVVDGQFRVRNFDRVGDAEGAMLLRPTRDYIAKVGQVSTMCTEEDNVHWFVPQGGRGTTFDVVISGLDEGAPDHVVQTVDPLRAARRPDGTLLTPIISFEESSRRYTAAV
jgi:hypothetical protein